MTSSLSRLKVKLTRNLRRSVLQGHPWIYREAIQMPSGVTRAQLARVYDNRDESLAWAYFDPHSPLALRILSTESPPPSEDLFSKRMERALRIRSTIRSERTNAYRLFNGEGDRLPGLVCDIYDDVGVIQFDGKGPSEFWNKEFIAQWLIENVGISSVLEKSRRNADRTAILIGGRAVVAPEVTILENGAKFEVDLEKGQKTGFFLDQRDNRDFVRQVSKGSSVLNLFSYTGGFSIAAGLGGATRVVSVDVAKGAIEASEKNWTINGLAPDRHKGIAADVFEYLKIAKSEWDHVVVDPPSMGSSEEGKEVASRKYVDLFALAVKKVKPGGSISLSSCSSHIDFSDFHEIITAALSTVRQTGRILRVSGQGADHPFPHACPELRYLKFVHVALD